MKLLQILTTCFIGFVRVGQICSSVFCASHSFFDKNKQIALSLFLKEQIALLLKSDNRDSLSSLFLKERQERLAQVALCLRSNQSDSIQSLFSLRATRAIHSRHSLSKEPKEQTSQFPTLGFATKIQTNKSYICNSAPGG